MTEDKSKKNSVNNSIESEIDEYKEDFNEELITQNNEKKEKSFNKKNVKMEDKEIQVTIKRDKNKPVENISFPKENENISTIITSANQEKDPIIFPSLDNNVNNDNEKTIENNSDNVAEEIDEPKNDKKKPVPIIINDNPKLKREVSSKSKRKFI